MRLIYLVRYNYIKCQNYVLPSSIRSFSTKPLLSKIPVDNTSYRTYQEMVYFYLHEKDYWKKIVKKLSDNQNQSDFTEITRFMNERTQATKTSENPMLHKLPYYIATMKDRFVPNQTVTSCDIYCSEIFDPHFAPSISRASSVEYIHGWLNYFHPQFSSIQQLTCFGKLLQTRCQEVLLSNQEDDLVDKLVHLTFLAGLGKKSFDNHEILNQVATFCDMNNSITYQVWNPFDMAIILECFFKGGIRIESEKSLNCIKSSLCDFLALTLQDPAQHFNPFIIISLLKILRQVNFIDKELLRLLSVLILHPLCEDKVRDIRFIINVAAAFSFPGCKNMHPTSNSRSSDFSMEKILERMDNLVLGSLQEEMSGKHRSDDSSSVKTQTELKSASAAIVVRPSRLKDISKWLWIKSSLGYQMCSKIYLQDLSRRFAKGQFAQKPSEGVDALLALAIMNQYPEDSMVLKILQNADFRSAVKVNCPNRHKGRFGLFLTAVRMERNSVWNQLSLKDEHQWFEAVRTPLTITKSNAWSLEHRKVKPLKIPGIKEDFKPHTQLLNNCMNALHQLFSTTPVASTKENGISDKAGDDKVNHKNATVPNLNSSSAKLNAVLLESAIDVPYHQGRRVQVFVGYAVPFFYIPGIKIDSPSNRKSVYVEVLDDLGLSSTYHNFKMRLMENMKYTYFKVSREEIQDLDTSGIMKLLEQRYRNVKSRL